MFFCNFVGEFETIGDELCALAKPLSRLSFDSLKTGFKICCSPARIDG